MWPQASESRWQGYTLATLHYGKTTNLTPSHPRRLPEEQRPEDIVGDAVDARRPARATGHATATIGLSGVGANASYPCGRFAAIDPLAC